ncbi:MAG: PHP domain-containing protein [Thermodesulfobacteriota bacterium]|nr:PHP domain-containing protein [Thermodesulfobacteriota bacterium]
MKFDLHTHTTLSACSSLDARDLIDAAGKAGLDGVCITDHQTMAIDRHITEGRQANGIVVIIGMEYATPDGDFLIFGPISRIPENLSADALLTEVDNCGGVAIAAHPFRKDRPVSETVVRDGKCTIMETINGRNSVLEDLKTSQWRKRYGLTETGGSDAHTPPEVGAAFTRFYTPVYSHADLVHALKNGLCQPEWNAQPACTRQHS